MKTKPSDTQVALAADLLIQCSKQEVSGHGYEWLLDDAALDFDEETSDARYEEWFEAALDRLKPQIIQAMKEARDRGK